MFFRGSPFVATLLLPRDQSILQKPVEGKVHIPLDTVIADPKLPAEVNLDKLFCIGSTDP